MRLRLVVVVASALACASQSFPEVADVREMGPSFGGPDIARVRDMGNPEVPLRGSFIDPAPDGVATTGELLSIEGDGFGKQPTVHIGGRPSEVLARTSGAGIVVRVPVGLAPG